MDFKKLVYSLIIFVSSISFSQEIPSSIVSVSNPDVKVLSSKNFMWSPKSIYVYEDERFKGFPVKQVFEEYIYKKLTSSGFTYVDTVDDAGVVVGYVLALESALSDVDINNLYGMNPGFVTDKSNTDKYEKGTIIIDIIEARTNRMVWRGALQGMADFKVSDRERKERIKTVVDRLLNEFIKKYGN